MLTSILRIFLTRSFCPFIFKGGPGDLMDLDVKNLGLYIHIPFCKQLCSFCPYYKVPYNRKLMEKYIESLLKEIDLVAGKTREKIGINSIYFGGGSPALAADFLPIIMTRIRKSFNIRGNTGIELHPLDIEKDLLRILRKTGFDMVSIGVQSFRENCLMALGREITDSRGKVKIASSEGFKVIDVDLIFGIPGQTPEDITEDFTTAVRYGATQISTYPFIGFSYTGLSGIPADKKMQKKMMDGLVDVSRKNGFERASVWTFLKKASQHYSSVTRDNYIGLGPSAATLTREIFKINTFSVDEYNLCLSENILPTALTLRFNDRRRVLYWLFWSAYNLKLSRKSFGELFGFELDSFFRAEIFLGKKFGLIKKDKDGYSITERGSRLYHMLEQVYTHQYIDKTWRSSIDDPWPEKLVLY